MASSFKRIEFPRAIKTTYDDFKYLSEVKYIKSDMTIVDNYLYSAKFNLNDILNSLMRSILLFGRLSKYKNAHITIDNLSQLSFARKKLLDVISDNKESMARIQSILKSEKILQIEVSLENISVYTNSREVTYEYDIKSLFINSEKLITVLLLCLNEILMTNEKDIQQNLINKKTEYLIEKLIENKDYIYKIESNNRDFDELIESYKITIEKLTTQLQESRKIHSELMKDRNTLSDQIQLISSIYAVIDGREDEIKQTVLSAKEINKAADDAKNINVYSAEIKNKSDEALQSARKVISIISGESIADDITKQENKENSSAKNWFTMSIILFFISLGMISINFYNNGVSWKTFIISAVILPITLSAMYFSTSQYIKRKSLADSYAYKKTLALSLTGFKTQINESENEVQTNYLLKAISLLTESPLNDLDRKHIKNELRALEKIRSTLIESIISTATNNIIPKKVEETSATNEKNIIHYL